MKYLITIIFALLIFTGQIKAAQLDSYYCFSTTEPQAVFEKFDNYLNSNAAKGLPVVRLWSMALNGPNPETHCAVFENADGDGFESMIGIFQEQEGQDFLRDLNTVIIDGLEGAGTPILSYGQSDFSKNPALILYNLRVKNPVKYAKIWSELMESSNFQGSGTLFEDTFTGETGRTHYIGMSGSSLESLRKELNRSLSSEEGKAFRRKAKEVRKVLSVYLMYHIKSWNE